MSDTTLTPLAERHYYVREKQFQITSEDVRAWLMEATRDRRKTTYELNFRIHRLGTALKSVQERAAELEAERDRLRAELETACQLAASAHATAQAAWGGEIPSPLPGHKHMAEDDLAAMDAHLDCPLCGGSGHIGDCDATAAGEVARLTAERDWLAGFIAEDGCPYLAFWSDFEGDMRPDWCICTDTADDGFECTGDPKECWKKEAARRAVAESEVRE